MTLNAFRENEILTKTSEFTVNTTHNAIYLLSISTGQINCAGKIFHHGLKPWKPNVLKPWKPHVLKLWKPQSAKQEILSLSYISLLSFYAVPFFHSILFLSSIL